MYPFERTHARPSVGLFLSSPWGTYAREWDAIQDDRYTIKNKKKLPPCPGTDALLQKALAEKVSTHCGFGLDLRVDQAQPRISPPWVVAAPCLVWSIVSDSVSGQTVVD